MVLGSVGSLVNIFQGNFFGGGSSEPPWVQEMREQFKIVNRKLDRIESTLGDIKDLIEWGPYKEKSDEFLEAIASYARRLSELPAPGREERDHEVDDLVLDYRINGQGLGVKLVLFLKNGEALQQYADYTKNHRQKMLKFMKVSLGRMMQAAEMDIAFLTLQSAENDPVLKSRTEHKAALWCGYFAEVQLKMAEIDNQVKNAWEGQAKYIDIPEFIEEHDTDKMNDVNFANKLLDFLNEKYYWRNWIVIVYEKGMGEEYHRMSGFYWLWLSLEERNLVVSSVSKRSSALYSIDIISAVQPAKNTFAGIDDCEAYDVYGYLPELETFMMVVINDIHAVYTDENAVMIQNLCEDHSATVVYFG